MKVVYINFLTIISFLNGNVAILNYVYLCETIESTYKENIIKLESLKL